MLADLLESENQRPGLADRISASADGLKGAAAPVRYPVVHPSGHLSNELEMQSIQDRTVAKDVQDDGQTRRGQERRAHLALLGDAKASGTQRDDPNQQIWNCDGKTVHKCIVCEVNFMASETLCGMQSATASAVHPRAAQSRSGVIVSQSTTAAFAEVAVSESTKQMPSPDRDRSTTQRSSPGSVGIRDGGSKGIPGTPGPDWRGFVFETQTLLICVPVRDVTRRIED